MKTPEKILIIEDDQNIANVLEINLKDIGFKIDWERDGSEGLSKALENESSKVTSSVCCLMRLNNRIALCRSS